jgi:nucleotide-binding universal stress UspA family protein
LGSIAEGVVHHARSPVLVARGGAWPPERVVVGDDGSEDAGRAAGLALGIGDLYGADGVLVHAYHNPPEPIGGWSADDRCRLDEAAQREQEAADERAKSSDATSRAIPRSGRATPRYLCSWSPRRGTRRRLCSRWGAGGSARSGASGSAASPPTCCGPRVGLS